MYVSVFFKLLSTIVKAILKIVSFGAICKLLKLGSLNIVYKSKPEMTEIRSRTNEPF